MSGIGCADCGKTSEYLLFVALAGAKAKQDYQNLLVKSCIFCRLIDKLASLTIAWLQHHKIYRRRTAFSFKELAESVAHEGCQIIGTWVEAVRNVDTHLEVSDNLISFRKSIRYQCSSGRWTLQSRSGSHTDWFSTWTRHAPNPWDISSQIHKSMQLS